MKNWKKHGPGAVNAELLAVIIEPATARNVGIAAQRLLSYGGDNGGITFLMISQ